MPDQHEAEEEYLPNVYLDFRTRYPDMAEALDGLGRAGEEAGPLSARDQRLVTLGIAIGALARGAVRSNVRKARDLGVPVEEIRHVVALAVSTCGFPAAVAAHDWVEEVLEERDAGA